MNNSKIITNLNLSTCLFSHTECRIIAAYLVGICRRLGGTCWCEDRGPHQKLDFAQGCDRTADPDTLTALSARAGKYAFNYCQLLQVTYKTFEECLTFLKQDMLKFQHSLTCIPLWQLEKCILCPPPQLHLFSQRGINVD